MPTNEHAAQDFETLHTATDDAWGDIDEPLSSAALVSSSFYTKLLHISHFHWEKDLKKTLATLSKRLADGETEEQFYAFRRVPREFVDRNDKNPSFLGCGTRIQYFWNGELMIVKLLVDLHEVAHYEFGFDIKFAALIMGIQRDEFIGTASSAKQGQESSKQADSSFKPWPAREVDGDMPIMHYGMI